MVHLFRYGHLIIELFQYTCRLDIDIMWQGQTSKFESIRHTCPTSLAVATSTCVCSTAFNIQVGGDVQAALERDDVCDVFQIFDGMVVMATCIVYVCLTVVVNEHLLAYSLSYVIVLRLWRLGRLYHGLYFVPALLIIACTNC